MTDRRKDVVFREYISSVMERRELHHPPNCLTCKLTEGRDGEISESDRTEPRP